MKTQLRFKIRESKGQSIMEVSILFVVIVFALISMQTYIKRAIQGSWRTGIDEIGDQYDPENTTSDYTVRHFANTSSRSISRVENTLLAGRAGTSQARYANVIITVTNTQVYYDNTITNGFENVPGF